MEIRKSFGEALRSIRIGSGLTQEAFSDISGRTYLSCVERGLKSPTVDKLDDFASVLGVHPVTLLAHCYAKADPSISTTELLERVRRELENIKCHVASD